MHIAHTAVTQGGFPNEVFMLVHEARHANGYFHDCAFRDLTISELGALGVQYYLGLWLADHAIAPPLSSAERAYARYSSEELRAYGAAFCTACGGI